MSARVLAQIATQVLEELRGLRADLGRARDRRQVGYGPADLITIEEAARLLRMSVPDARRLVTDRGLVRSYDGRRRIIVGDLLAAHDHAAPAALQAASRRPRRRAVGWDDL